MESKPLPKSIADDIILEVLRMENCRNSRREASVLIAALKGLEQIPKDADPHAVLACAEETLSNISKMLLYFDGSVSRISRNGIMASFGAPNPMAGHESRAALCAVEIQRFLLIENMRRQLNGCLRMDVGISLASGAVYSGRIEKGSPRDCAVFGEPVEIAERILTFAQPGQILATSNFKGPLADKVHQVKLNFLALSGWMNPPDVVEIRVR